MGWGPEMIGIRTRPLGRTGLEVSEIGLGGVFISGKKTSREEAVRVIHRALEAGVDYIDTAPFYGNSQEIIGEALAGRKERVVLGTKCGRWDWQTGPYRSLDAFKEQFERSLKDLRRDSVDVLYVHEADWAVYWKDMELPRGRCHLDPAAAYDYASAPVARFLLWAKKQGLARHIGISGNSAGLLAKVLRESQLPLDVVLVAFQYSLLWREAREELLPLAREMNVGVVLGAPFQQGRLVAPRPEWLDAPPDWMDEALRGRFRSLYAIQRETGLPLTELGLRFLLADPDFATVIPGAANVEQLEQNARCSAAGPLPVEVHEALATLVVSSTAAG